MKRIVKVLTNKDIMCPLVSALGAFISALLAGCKLAASDLSFEIGNYHSITNSIMEITR